MASRRIEVEIIGDSRSLERAFGRASASSSRLGRTLAGAGRAALTGAAIAGGAALTGLGIAAKVGFDEFRESARVTEQLNARLKSTGNVANVTMKGMDRLAQSVLGYSGIDDEATKATEAMLLSFRKIRNEAGKGNDIFDQTTKAIADVATAYNQGAIPSSEQMQQVTIQIGKALQDPIKGLTALRRVGITFTDQQQEQIKTLVENGEQMKAQKLILAELTKEFGGSAEAAGRADGGLTRLKETFKNLAAEGIQPVIPLLLRLTDWVTEHLPEIRKVFHTVFRGVSRAVGAAADFVRAHWPTVQTVFAAVLDFVIGTLLPAFNRLRRFVTKVVTDVVAVFQKHKADLTEIWENVKSVVSDVVGIFQDLAPLIRKAIPGALNVAIPVIRDFFQALAIAADIADRTADAINRVVDALSRVKGPSLSDIKGPSGLDLFRQHGGPVKAGRPYIVGERRPELFVPKTSGRILPRVPAMGGGGSRQPLQVVVQVDRRVLGSVLVDLDREHARLHSGRGLFD